MLRSSSENGRLYGSTQLIPPPIAATRLYASQHNAPSSILSRRTYMITNQSSTYEATSLFDGQVIAAIVGYRT